MISLTFHKAVRSPREFATDGRDVEWRAVALGECGQGPGRSCAPRVDSVTVLAMTMATFASMGAALVVVMAIMAPTEAAFMTRLPAALASVMEVGTGMVTVGSPSEM